VPAAVIFDLGRGGDFGHRPDRTFGVRAAGAARAVTGRGAVGAGTGARAGGLQGGVGMASITLDIGGVAVTVAALAVVNASGSLFDLSTGLPWQRRDFLRRPPVDERAALRAAWDATHAPPLNTTIGVVATDAALVRPEAGRLAQSAHDGLARAVRPAHSLMDGDTVFGLATGATQIGSTDAGIVRGIGSRASHLNLVFAAAADAFETACVDAVLATTSLGSAPSYRDLCPSAFRA
jgi:L-aminopeptidase/D-esterase-like protein